ncbi:MAG: hypothetical protein AAGB22_00125 [Bacteroidota bacterium]
MTEQPHDQDAHPGDLIFRAGFSVDIVLLTYHSKTLQVLLERKKVIPVQDQWGLPGSLIMHNQETDQCMDALLLNCIGTTDLYKKQLQAFSQVDRHPLGRVITFAYYGLIAHERVTLNRQDDLRWCPLHEARHLSYDHDLILKRVLYRFRKGLLRHPIVFELLPAEFIISDIIKLYELAFGKQLDGPNFRGRLRRSRLIAPLGKYWHPPGSIGRPAELYTFQREKYHGQSNERIQFNF